jgi:hypothetical protein
VKRHPDSFALENVEVRGNDIKFAAKRIDINRGRIGIFKTALFWNVSAKGLKASLATGEVTELESSKVKAKFPLGTVELQDGAITLRDGNSNRFEACLLSARMGKIVSIQELSPPGTPSRKPRKTFLGLRTAYFEKSNGEGILTK